MISWINVRDRTVLHKLTSDSPFENFLQILKHSPRRIDRAALRHPVHERDNVAGLHVANRLVTDPRQGVVVEAAENGIGVIGQPLRLELGVSSHGDSPERVGLCLFNRRLLDLARFGRIYAQGRLLPDGHAPLPGIG